MPAPPSNKNIDKKYDKNINKEIANHIDNFKDKLHLPHSDSISDCDEERNYNNSYSCDEYDEKEEIISYPICDIV